MLSEEFIFLDLPLLAPDTDKAKMEKSKELLVSTYTKLFAISHANEEFINLSSTRKEKVVRALFLGDAAIRRMWEVEGVLHYEVMSYRYFKELEFMKIDDIEAVRKFTKIYTVMYNPWKMTWHCDCQYSSLYAGIDDCTHIVGVRLMNILKEYIPYFIYAYRFLLPHKSYKYFMLSFNHRIN